MVDSSFLAIYTSIFAMKGSSRIKQQKRERQTDRQTGKQSTDYISQIRLLI